MHIIQENYWMQKLTSLSNPGFSPAEAEHSTESLTMLQNKLVIWIEKGDDLDLVLV